MRNRVRSAACVAGFIAGTRWVWPDSLERAQWEYLLTATLGYGHLIGAAWPRPRPPLGAATLERSAFVATSALTGLAAYAWLLDRWPPLFLMLLALSVWHTVENDLGLSNAYRTGAFRIGPVSRSPRFHARVLGAWLCLSGLSLQTAEWRDFVRFLSIPAALDAGDALLLAAGITGAALVGSGDRSFGAVLSATAACFAIDVTGLRSVLSLADIFVAATLYHLISWLGLFADRLNAMGPGREANRLARRLALVHAIPAALCVGLLVVESQPLAGDGVAFVVFAPGIYLFWSALHVGYTAISRGWERAS